MSDKIEIHASWRVQDGSILIDTTIDGLVKQIGQVIVDAQDRAVREGLVAMGWTPPGEAPAPKVPRYTDPDYLQPMMDAVEGVIAGFEERENARAQVEKSFGQDVNGGYLLLPGDPICDSFSAHARRAMNHFGVRDQILRSERHHAAMGAERQGLSGMFGGLALAHGQSSCLGLFGQGGT